MLSVASGYSPQYLLKEVATGRENYYTGAVADGEPPGPLVGCRRGEARPDRAGRRAGHDARSTSGSSTRAHDGFTRPGPVGRGVHPRAHRPPVPVRGRVVRRGA